MLHSTHYKPSTIEASKKTLRKFLELHQETVQGLVTTQLVIEDHDTPLDPQVLQELEHLYATAHRMLSQELAKVEHIEAMQEARRNAEKAFGILQATRGKSNQAQQATA